MGPAGNVERNPRPTSDTGHVVSDSGEQSGFLVEIPLEIVAIS